jgi:hypothetical protein
VTLAVGVESTGPYDRRHCPWNLPALPISTPTLLLH